MSGCAGGPGRSTPSKGGIPVSTLETAVAGPVACGRVTSGSACSSTGLHVPACRPETAPVGGQSGVLAMRRQGAVAVREATGRVPWRVECLGTPAGPRNEVCQACFRGKKSGVIRVLGGHRFWNMGIAKFAGSSIRTRKDAGAFPGPGRICSADPGGRRIDKGAMSPPGVAAGEPTPRNRPDAELAPRGNRVPERGAWARDGPCVGLPIRRQAGERGSRQVQPPRFGAFFRLEFAIKWLSGVVTANFCRKLGPDFTGEEGVSGDFGRFWSCWE